MMTKLMVNFSFKIAAQFLQSNQCGRLAGAGAPYLSQENAGFFSRQRTTNKVKVRKIDEDESQMDDD